MNSFLPCVVCSREQDDGPGERLAVQVADDVVEDALVGRRRDALGQRDADVAVAGLAVKHFDARLSVRSLRRHRRHVRPVEALHQVDERDGLVIIGRNCTTTTIQFCYLFIFILFL